MSSWPYSHSDGTGTKQRQRGDQREVKVSLVWGSGWSETRGSSYLQGSSAPIREKTSLFFKVLIFWKSGSVGKTLPSCLRSSETSWKAKHLCPSFLTPGLRESFMWKNAHFWASKKNKYKGRLSSWPGLIRVIKLTIENDLLLTALQCLPNNISMSREL